MEDIMSYLFFLYAVKEMALYIGVGEPTASDSVNTHGFQIKGKPRVQTKIPSSKMPWVAHYKKCYSQLAVRAHFQMEQGTF